MSQNTKFVWRANEVPEELLELLRTIEEEYPVSDFGRGLKLKFRRIEAEETTSNVMRAKGEVTVEYSSIAAAARGIGTALAGLNGKETTPFRTLGIMLDISRGMVMTVEHLKMWFRRLALAGYNMVMLYAEDIYELPNEPFFGRMRGPYSAEEIRELDAYAKQLGIELIGCIQTLGHLEQIIRWEGAYGKVTDSRRELLVDEPETYKLIGKMLRFWSENLTSRRIHIGMDETQDLGRGMFMNRHGYENPFEIFNRHLAKVNDICKENGLTPMIWSDMYFRFGNEQHEYYQWDSPIPKSVQERIPKNVNLVFWDYYHSDTNTYEQMITRHRSIGFEPIMGSGIWTWLRLWYDHKQTMDTVVPCITACRKLKVKELFFTMWGDDGGYCNYDSSLAGILRGADLAFGVSSTDEDPTRDRFAAICMSDYDAVITGSKLQNPVNNGHFVASQLIWDDPLMGIYYDECLKTLGQDFALQLIDRYEEMLCDLLPLQDEAAAGDFEHLTNILVLLIKKLELRSMLLDAYAHDDRIALRQIAVSVVPAVIAAVQEFDASFRAQWLDCAKPFGLETIQLRNGGQIARLEETALRIREYLDDQVNQIDELDARIPSDIKNNFNFYKFIASGSMSRF